MERNKRRRKFDLSGSSDQIQTLPTFKEDTFLVYTSEMITLSLLILFSNKQVSHLIESYVSLGLLSHEIWFGFGLDPLLFLIQKDRTSDIRGMRIYSQDVWTLVPCYSEVSQASRERYDRDGAERVHVEATISVTTNNPLLRSLATRCVYHRHHSFFTYPSFKMRLGSRRFRIPLLIRMLNRPSSTTYTNSNTKERSKSASQQQTAYNRRPIVYRTMHRVPKQ
jgi:hypothetical protein